MYLFVSLQAAGRQPAQMETLQLRCDYKTLKFQSACTPHTTCTTKFGLPTIFRRTTVRHLCMCVFQATFDYDTLVTGITTQGRGNAAQWVTSFTLEYSADEGATYTRIQKNGADVVCTSMLMRAW